MNGPICMGQTMRALQPDLSAVKRPVLIVFDLDGTLTDSEDLGRQLFKRVFTRMGFGEIGDEKADSFNGPSSDEVCRIMGIEDRKEEYNALVDEIEADLVRTQGIVFPGVREMLESLAPYAHLAILTNGSPIYCSVCIEEYGFAPYISLQAGFTSGVTKAMRIGMWERELGARRVIVVGDRSTDISNARAAGAYAIGVTFGMGSVEELMDADSLCDSAQEVTRVCMRVIAEV